MLGMSIVKKGQTRSNFWRGGFQHSENHNFILQTNCKGSGKALHQSGVDDHAIKQWSVWSNYRSL